MIPIALCCTRQSRAPNIDRCTPESWPWPLTLTPTFDLKARQQWCKTHFLAYDLDPWPTTLTYLAILAKVKFDLHAKDEGRRSNGSSVRVQTKGGTDRRTDGQTDATKCIISIASRSIISGIRVGEVVRREKTTLHKAPHMYTSSCHRAHRGLVTMYTSIQRLNLENLLHLQSCAHTFIKGRSVSAIFLLCWYLNR